LTTPLFWRWEMFCHRFIPAFPVANPARRL
jgi:hypothetical protein